MHDTNFLFLDSIILFKKFKIGERDEVQCMSQIEFFKILLFFLNINICL